MVESPVSAAEARLGGMHLLNVARGGSSPASAMIKDHTVLPALPASHRDYERRLERNHDAMHKNEQNAEQRYTIEMTAWTRLYLPNAKYETGRERRAFG